MTNVARNFERENKKSVVLCDRGMLDGKAYAGDENWAKMLSQIHVRIPLFRSLRKTYSNVTKLLSTWWLQPKVPPNTTIWEMLSDMRMLNSYLYSNIGCVTGQENPAMLQRPPQQIYHYQLVRGQ